MHFYLSLATVLEVENVQGNAGLRSGQIVIAFAYMFASYNIIDVKKRIDFQHGMFYLNIRTLSGPGPLIWHSSVSHDVEIALA
jgi:hypothetical protein